MVATTIGKSLHCLTWSSKYLFSNCPVLLRAVVLRSPLLQYHPQRMSTSAEFEKLKARAEETERRLADLQAQIDVIRKNAVKQAGLAEEAALAKENENLRNEIESVKRDLILAEIGNGVPQVPMPTKGALQAITTPQTTSTTSVPLVNGTEVAAESKPKLQETSENKTQLAELPSAGGKKAKVDKKGKESKSAGGEGKSKKVAATAGGDEGTEGPMDVSRLDLRVGKIVAVDRHPDADTLYVEQVDLGEGRHRTVVSGLVKHFPVNAMKDRIAVFMCNLKPTKLRGILSEAMIMCAVGPEKTEILVPPTDSVIGDRVVVQEYPGTPDEQLNPKKKIWETLKPDMRTSSDRIAAYKGAHWTIPGKGVVVAPTLGDVQIS